MLAAKRRRAAAGVVTTVDDRGRVCHATAVTDTATATADPTPTPRRGRRRRDGVQGAEGHARGTATGVHDVQVKSHHLAADWTHLLATPTPDTDNKTQKSPRARWEVVGQKQPSTARKGARKSVFRNTGVWGRGGGSVDPQPTSMDRHGRVYNKGREKAGI